MAQDMDIQEVVKNYLDGQNRLKVFPSKRTKKLLALQYLATKFEEAVEYSEKEVNAIIDRWHTFDDICLLRRELYNNHLLNRTRDSSKYWKEINEED